MQYYKNKATKYLSDEEIEKNEKAKDELYKERCRLSDQRREYNKILREEARFEHLKEVLLDRLDCLPQIEFNKNIKNNINSDIEAVMLCSDWHIGLTIDNTKNFFNMDVALDRIKQFTEKTIKYCKFHNVKKLNVLLLGDLISGIIQQTARIEQEEDCTQQLMNISEILSRMLNKLKENIEEVVVYSCWGNHARQIADKKNSLNRENMERLVPFYLRKTVKNIKIIDSHVEDFIEFTVKNKKCLMEHGDKTHISKALNDTIRLLGYVPDHIFLGHTHAYQDYDDCDTQITVNGCLCGSDDYAISLRKSTKPCQILKIFDEDTITYKIGLD